MNKNTKIAFAIGAVLTKKLGKQVTVCRVGDSVEWRLPVGGYGVADASTISPKDTLGNAFNYLSYKMKMSETKKGK